MDKTRALDKIRKCLALAKSSNSGEAGIGAAGGVELIEGAAP